MADTWAIEGAWFKNCNCDPGCPCDFNQAPTHDNCEGIIGMRIDGPDIQARQLELLPQHMPDIRQ